MSIHRDVLIIGAGPSGLALANALSREGLNVTVLEKLSAAVLADPPPDGRDIALTHRSQSILRSLGIWDRLPQTEIAEIRTARVLHGTAPQFLQFDANQSGKSALGFLVSNHLLRKAAYESVRDAASPNVEIIDNVNVTGIHAAGSCSEVTLSDGRTLSATLAVAADSRFSESRRRMGVPAHMHDFARVVIVARMKHEHANDGVAYECFLLGGTLAVLPLNDNQCSVVITLSADRASEIANCPPAQFNQWVAEQFEHRLGTMQLTGERHSYPLVAVYARHFYAERFALLGDAAVGMHPVTAHGYNFGLYGVDSLVHEISKARRAGQDIGADAVLRRYQRTHRRATLPIFLGTNALVKLYTDDRMPARVARRGLLRIADRLPPLKSWITRRLTDMPSPARLRGF
ncbi:MAG: 5-demethoxyubiquinol-8 5-hydroxylase UbiM [Usitatibacteraceae bacterium]